MSLTGVKDMKAESAHASEDPRNGLDARPRERNVVAEQIDVAPFAAEVRLHVDDQKRSVLGSDVAIEGPSIRIRRYVLHPTSSRLGSSLRSSSGNVSRRCRQQETL